MDLIRAGLKFIIGQISSVGYIQSSRDITINGKSIINFLPNKEKYMTLECVNIFCNICHKSTIINPVCKNSYSLTKYSCKICESKLHEAQPSLVEDNPETDAMSVLSEISVQENKDLGTAESNDSVIHKESKNRLHIAIDHSLKAPALKIEDSDMELQSQTKPISRMRNYKMEKHETHLRAKSERYQFISNCTIINTEGSKTYKCPTCTKIFKRASDFMIHQTVHTGEKPHICDLCGKSFRIASNLKKHKTDYHMRIKKFTCDVCNKQYVAKEVLKLHMNSHSENLKFVCDLCGKGFRQYNSLYHHKRAHKGLRPHVCDICGKRFLVSESLKTHMRTHTGERPFCCEICGSSFTAKTILKDHLKTHLDTSFPCSLCSRTFKLEKSLKYHIKLKHRNDTT